MYWFPLASVSYSPVFVAHGAGVLAGDAYGVGAGGAAYDVSGV